MEETNKKPLSDIVKSKEVETEKYLGIRLVSRFSRIIGIIVFVIYLFLSFIGLFAGKGGFWGKLFYFLQYFGVGFIFLVIGFFIGDVFQVLVDIEKNTRKKREET